MPYLVVNILLAGVPSVLVLLFLLWNDRRRREPSRLILPGFLLGFIAVLPALGAEIALKPYGALFSGAMGDLFRAFAIAGAVEEGAKYLAVRVFLYPRGSFRRITDGITTAVAAGLGFAFFENIFYTFGSFETLLLRGLTSVPLHAAASGILGYHLGTQKFSYRPAGPRGLAAAAAVHGLYNFFLFRGSWLSILTVPTVYFALRFVIRAYRRAQALDREEGRD